MGWLIIVAGALLVLFMPRRALAYSGGQAIGEINLSPIGGGYYLADEAAAAFSMMQSAAHQEGVSLQVNSAFRTMDQQQSLYQQLISGLRTDPVARPGYSNHQSGVAVDIEVNRSNTSRTYLWLKSNGPRYGYVNVGATFSSPEYWHWEYKPHV